MLKACSRCGKVHAYNACSVPVVDNYKRKRTEQMKFRSGALWQRKRAEIVERDCYVCRLCLDEGKLTRDSLEVHHIVPIKVNQSLKLVNDNLITLCSDCHELVEGDVNSVDRLRALAISPPLLKF